MIFCSWSFGWTWYKYLYELILILDWRVDRFARKKSWKAQRMVSGGLFLTIVVTKQFLINRKKETFVIWPVHAAFGPTLSQKRLVVIFRRSLAQGFLPNISRSWNQQNRKQRIFFPVECLSRLSFAQMENDDRTNPPFSAFNAHVKFITGILLVKACLAREKLLQVCAYSKVELLFAVHSLILLVSREVNRSPWSSFFGCFFSNIQARISRILLMGQITCRIGTA